MRERFSGILGTTPRGESTPIDGINHQRLAAAECRFDNGVDVARFGDDMIIAVGAPRFASSDLDTTASDRGVAHAWHQALQRADGGTMPDVRGRFAVVWIRDQGQRAMIMTDRFATYPVCFAHRDGALYFADRADAVPVPAKRLSNQAIFDFLFFHMIPAPTTIFEGVQRLPAAHVLEWSADRLAVRPWWTPRFSEDRSLDLDSAKRQFMQIVEDGVRREATGDAVGCFLSGGTDSSTVTGMLCKITGRPAPSYSIGFDATGYDEMEYARLAATHFGADHRAYYVTPEDLLDGIPTVARHYDQPFGNSSAVPAWVCASKARGDGITKLLAGDGGDELFGGNTRYAKQKVFGWYDYLPAPLRHHLMEPLLGQPAAARIPLVKKAASYVEQAKVPLPDRMQMYNMLILLGMDKVFDPAFLSGVDTRHPFAQMRDTWAATEGADRLNRMLALDWKYTLSDNDLPKVIGTTGLAGLDVGFPLLSDELTDFSLTLPTDWKLKGFTLRWFFKEALRDFLPADIITKKKHGFGLPFGVWACQHDGLREMTHEALSGFKARGIVAPTFIDDLINTHLPAHPGYYGEMAWILMMMEFWLRDQHA